MLEEGGGDEASVIERRVRFVPVRRAAHDIDGCAAVGVRAADHAVLIDHPHGDLAAGGQGQVPPDGRRDEQQGQVQRHQRRLHDLGRITVEEDAHVLDDR